MRKRIFLLISLVASIHCYSQFLPGTLILMDGTEISGEISWEHDYVNVISQGIQQAYFANEVDHFTVNDTSTGEGRTFYSLADETSKSGENILFEVIVESPEYAFLLKTQRFVTEKPATGVQRKGNYVPKNISRVYGTYTSVRTEETIYFARPQGGMQQVAVFTTNDQIENVKLLNKPVLEEFTQTSFNQLQRSAEEKNLNLRHLEDMITLIEYYAKNKKSPAINSY